MSWQYTKTDEGRDFIFDGIEQGIAPSPVKGVANIQNANISTETGEVMASFNRVNEVQAALSAQTLTASVGDGATLLAAPSTLKAGQWIKATASSVSSITAATNPSTATLTYLVVGGGGGGGGVYSGASAGGGGGGAGGYLASTYASGVASYAVTVGAGGAGGNNAPYPFGASGSDSVFGSVATATGGGGGGGTSSPGAVGLSGGSGGGGGGSGNGGAGGAGAGTGGQGHNGGVGNTTTAYTGAGGGGATAVGADATTTNGGAGGAGTANSITGTSVTYAGGGGGGAGSGAFAGTATGGGGNGANAAVGNAGTANTGGGGGGAGTATASTYGGGAGGSGIVVVSYVTGSMLATGGEVSIVGANTIHTFKSSGLFKVVTIATGGYYYVSYKDTNNKIKLSANFDPTCAHALTHGTSGTITFDTVAVPNQAIAKATENYTTATTSEFRYYILDAQGFVWCYDTATYKSSLAGTGVATTWMLPDPIGYSSLAFAGMAVLNGWLMVVSNSTIYGKPVVNLGEGFLQLPGTTLNEPFPTHNSFAYVGHQGKMYYCDGNYIGELFPTTSLVTSVANVQSVSSYTAVTTTGTISAIIDGSLPYAQISTKAIPVVFFTDQYGTLPTAVTPNKVYFIHYDPIQGTFQANTLVGGTGAYIDLQTGATGNQYFNTFYPVSYEAGIAGANATVQFTAQRVNLPATEVAQCMVEVGNIIIIGGNSNTLYPWNQVDATPSDFIELPEADVKAMVNVNNMAYVFAGNRGNVYITNTAVASLVLKVPDYVAGVPGTPISYIEPIFTWGDATYLRGRVYFSILDQTATKAGNCGGVWSFIPTQNMYIGQDVGLALRLENQNSYGTYSGYASILIANEQQAVVSPQYWAAWQNSYNTGSAAFGIDNTGTVPVTTYVVETDMLPTGTILSKDSFSQLEYKLTTFLAAGDSIQLFYRLNTTDAWTSCGTVNEEAGNRIAGYFDVNFQKTQWVQFRIVATTTGDATSSFCRLKQTHLR